jgi:hypothetical protein
VMQAATEYSRLRVGAGGGAMQAAKEYSSYFEPPKRARSGPQECQIRMGMTTHL